MKLYLAKALCIPGWEWIGMPEDYRALRETRCKDELRALVADQRATLTTDITVLRRYDEQTRTVTLFAEAEAISWEAE